jgi:HAD superfamily hydrolase (TIGR01509 family)
MAYGLIFDCDGVLADTEPIIAEATIAALRELYGVELTPKDFEPYIGTGAYRYTVGPAEDHGIDIDPETAIQLRHDKYMAILAEREDISNPGVHGLVAAVHSDPDWTLAIATSSPGPKAHGTFEAARIDLDRFAVIVTGDDVEHKKPHPEIYLKAGDRLGIAPDHCVVVEDAVSGVRSGKAAGMYVIGLQGSFSTEALRGAGADDVVQSLEALNVDRLRALVETRPKTV